MAPFGAPVVPDVYWICPASPGCTRGSSCPGAPSVKRPLRQEPGVAQRRQLAAHLGQCRGHVAAAELGGVEHAGGARLAEHVGQLGGAVGRVDRHQRETRQRRRHLQEHPLKRADRPSDDVLAWLKMSEQRTRSPLGLGEELREGEAAARRRGRCRRSAPRGQAPRPLPRAARLRR
jgi:hypothetical protein